MILTGNFIDLLQFRIGSGDETLQKHFATASKNATYTSWDIQNQIINLCGATIKDMIIEDVQKASAYSIMADETGDVSGKEQLSVGIRFFDQSKMIIREEFLGYVVLKAQDALSIATAINKFIEDCHLDPKKCVGQGYDGCPAMSGIKTGVHKRLQTTFTKALYFHCADHRLNLIVNDLSEIPEIRNTIATVKNIINFFRESPQRRESAPNVSKLCETRWSEKYKSIARFKRHLVELINALDTLSKTGNKDTRPVAFNLHAAATKSVFIICICIIAKYSALLEPVVNLLQSKNVDLFKCSKHIERIRAVISEHHTNADITIQEILKDAEEIAKQLGIALEMPRIIQRQVYRSNPPSETPADYWKRAILLGYLHSFSEGLADRFAVANSPAFSLLDIHPSNMLQKSMQYMKNTCKEISDFYEIDNLLNEIEIWYDVWQMKNLDKDALKKLDLVDVYEEAREMFPSVKLALEIAMALPCTTADVERSFSTLRKVKTWLRSTMTEDRLNGNLIIY